MLAQLSLLGIDVARKKNPKRMQGAIDAGWSTCDCVSVAQGEAMALAKRYFGHRPPEELSALSITLRRSPVEIAASEIKRERKRLRNNFDRNLPDVVLLYWIEYQQGKLHIHGITASSRPREEIEKILTGEQCNVRKGHKRTNKRHGLYAEERDVHIQPLLDKKDPIKHLARWAWYANKRGRNEKNTDTRDLIKLFFKAVPESAVIGKIGLHSEQKKLQATATCHLYPGLPQQRDMPISIPWVTPSTSGHRSPLIRIAVRVPSRSSRTTTSAKRFNVSSVMMGFDRLVASIKIANLSSMVDGPSDAPRRLDGMPLGGL